MRNQQRIYEEDVSKKDANAFQKPKSNIDSQFTRRPKSQKQIKDEYDEWKEWTNKESSSQQYSVSVSSTNSKHRPTGHNCTTTTQCNPIIYKPEKHVSFFFIYAFINSMLNECHVLIGIWSNGLFDFIDMLFAYTIHKLG